MGPVSASVGKISTPGDRFKASRKLYLSNPKETRKHYARLGAVIHAYNSAHSYVYRVFAHACSPDSHDASRELWFSQPSDSAQRQLALNYIENNRLLTKSLRSSLVWAIKSLGKLATLRNDIAHADMVWAYDQLEPGFLSRDAARKRMAAQPFHESWNDLRGDLSALANYLGDLSWDVSGRNTRPSTNRPRLKLVKIGKSKR